MKKSQLTMGGKARWWGSPLRHGSYWKEWNILKISESGWEDQNPKPPKGLLDEERGKEKKGQPKKWRRLHVGFCSHSNSEKIESTRETVVVKVGWMVAMRY